MSDDTTSRLRVALLWVVVALSVVLAGTGLWLTFSYRPSAAQAWNDVVATPSGGVRLAHRLASFLLLPVLVALFAVHLPVARRRVAAGALALLGLALSVTGYLLPWDQLALWAVTVDTDVTGAWPAAFGDNVRFVLIGGTEITQGTYRLWFLVHTALLASVFAAVLAALVVVARRGRARH